MADDNPDAYILGAHEGESRRLTLNHEIITESTGTLVFSPVDLSPPNLKILDSATANGRWLVDLRATYPNQKHEYVGTDITDAMFPKPVPDGITLTKQDICKPWPAEWANSFDYVHQRLGLAGVATQKDVIRRQCELVKPGGWIEFVEVDTTSNDSPTIAKLWEFLREMLDVLGSGRDYFMHMKGALEEAGMEDVEDKLVEIQVGKSARTPELGAKTIKSMQLAAEAFIPAVDKLPPLSLSKSDLQTLVGELKDDLEERGGSYVLRIASGRKPL